MKPTAELRVIALPGSIRPRDGWSSPTDARAEADWLPVVGPACFVLWRRLAGALLEHQAGIRVRADELAVTVGLGPGSGEQSGLMRSLRRLQRFGLLWRAGDDLYVVRCHLPLLDESRLQTLRPIIRRMQHELQAAAGTDEPGATS